VGFAVVMAGRWSLVPEAVVGAVSTIATMTPVCVVVCVLAVIIVVVVVTGVLILAVVILSVIIVLAALILPIIVVVALIITVGISRIVQGRMIAILIVALAEVVAGGDGPGLLSVVGRRPVLSLAMITIRVVLRTKVRIAGLSLIVVLGRIVLGRGCRSDGEKAYES
jgi:hypothetical protein